MQSQNIGFLVLKSIFYDTVRDIVRFPFWWYTKGLLTIWLSFINGTVNADRTLGVSIWVKNIFQPMYGQYDLTGRIISVIIRIFQIITRAILLILWVFLLFLRVVFWITIPLIIVSQILYQITGGFFISL